MSLFIKKLVDKASHKKLPADFSPDPCLTFHYGIPSGSMLLAYDSTSHILAISTKDGLIKLFGKHGSQALLESPIPTSTKFLLFINNQSCLVNVNDSNHIEVWDVEKRSLTATHQFHKEVTSISAIFNGLYLYVGDSEGDISVLRLHQEQSRIELMKYCIPLPASHGNTSNIGSDTAVKFVLPQPSDATKRVIVIYSDGTLVLWATIENKVLFSNKGSTGLQSEAKKVTAACWACSVGTKVCVGYGNGDIILWSIPSSSDPTGGYITPISKLNLGYKADRIPITMLKWSDIDGKLSKLYVLGCSEFHPTTNSLQVVLLTEQNESRTIKLGLPLSEISIDMEICTSSSGQGKPKRDTLLLLGKSNHSYSYDDVLIERYLLQCQAKMSSSVSLPKECTIKLPYGDSSITIIKLVTSLPCAAEEEDYNTIVKNSLSLFPFEKNVEKSSSYSNTPNPSLFSKTKNLLITGHSSGAVNFWDASCPRLLQLASLSQQSDGNLCSSGNPVTALHFCYNSRVLISGDQNGMVRIYLLKAALFVPHGSFHCFLGSAKRGNNQIIERVKSMKVNGAVVSINSNETVKQVAVGTEQGYVFLIDPEGPTVLYQRQIAASGIGSIHFETFEIQNNVIIAATKDCSVFSVDKETGTMLSIGPKKLSQALFTGIFVTDRDSTQKESFLLLCSKKVIYAYSLPCLIQGVKKVIKKKKLRLPCYFASTFGNPAAGLVLLYITGNIEIRSLVDFSLVKECSIRPLTISNCISDMKVSSSHDGEIVIVNGEQELFFISVFQYKQTYKFLDHVSKVHKNDEAVMSTTPKSKESRKGGIFGSILKENTKPTDEEAGDSLQNVEEQLRKIFSAANISTTVTDETDHDLNIDDIDIEDSKDKKTSTYAIEKAKLYKHNIANSYQAVKEKLKHAKAKPEKIPECLEIQDQRNGAVDQIKKKYGYDSASSNAMQEPDTAANQAKTKLGENLNKLQGIGLKVAEMRETASSFSSMAREVLRYSENGKKG